MTAVALAFLDDPRRKEFGIIIHLFPEGKYPIIAVDIHDNYTHSFVVVRLPLRILMSTGNSGIEGCAGFGLSNTYSGIKIR